MTSTAHKGIPGGDPSRRPIKVKMNVPCAFCNANIDFMGNGKSIPTLFCSEACKYQNRKNEIIKALRKHGINLSNSKNRSSTSLTSLLNTCDMIKTVSKGKKIYVSPKRNCATCNESFSYLSPVPIKNVRLYCSATCNKNRSSRVSEKGAVLCPRPEKIKFASIEESDAHLRTMMDDDIARNQDLVSYTCVCEHVHFGSLQKSIFEKELFNLIEEKKNELHSLLIQKPHLKVKS